MKAALRKVQQLVRQSVLSPEREQPKAPQRVQSWAEPNPTTRAQPKARRKVRRSVLSPEWEQAKEQLRVPLLAMPRRKTNSNLAWVGLSCGVVVALLSARRNIFR